MQRSHYSVIYGNNYKIQTAAIATALLWRRQYGMENFLNLSVVIHCVPKKACDAIYLSIIRILIARL